MTSFPFGSQVLTGVFLDIVTSGPNQFTQTYERTLADRIGYVARQTGASSGLNISPSAQPLLTDLDLFTVDVLTGLNSPTFPGRLPQTLPQAQIAQPTAPQGSPAFDAQANGDLAQERYAVTDLNRAFASYFTTLSDGLTTKLAQQNLVKAYFTSPRIVITASRVGQDATTLQPTLVHSIDLRADSTRVLAYPGQAQEAAVAFNAVRGVSESLAEQEALTNLDPDPNGMGAASIVQAAMDEGIPLTAISSRNLSNLDSLDISAEAKGRITSAIMAGKSVVVPTRSVDLSGMKAIAWYEVNPTTGETIGVGEDGEHQFFENSAIYGAIGYLSGFLLFTVALDCVFTISHGVNCLTSAGVYLQNKPSGNAFVDKIAFEFGKIVSSIGHFFDPPAGPPPPQLDASHDTFAEQLQTILQVPNLNVATPNQIGAYLISPGPSGLFGSLQGTGVASAIVSDPRYTVPLGGALLPTAYLVGIKNTGAASDNFNLSATNIPAGFTAVTSVSQIEIPAGATAEIGLYLIPTGPLPAPGTSESFGIKATSSTSTTVTSSSTETITVPEVHAVTVVSGPSTLNSTPGAPITATLTLTNVGNVSESVSLADTLPSGLLLNGLAPATLAAGQSASETITLTPAASVPLQSMLVANVIATFGSSTAPGTNTARIVIDVVVPGAAAIANAALAANLLGNTGLVGRLGDLSTALTNLVQNPTSTVYKGQAVANLDSLISQLTNDRFLSGFTAGLTAARAALPGAVTAADVQSAVSQLGTALQSLATAISDDAEHGFTLSLSPDRNVVAPSAPEVFTIVMTNRGSTATTYDLGVVGLPAGVTAVFSQPKVILQPGQSIGPGNNAVTLTLTESGNSLVPANFMVQAAAEGAMEINQSTPGFLMLRDEAILVAGIVTNPTFADPGGQVDVSAKIQSAVNQATQISASYTVTDATGHVLFTSTAVPVTLAVSKALTTIDLGSFDTTGFAQGVETITVSLSSSGGQPLPGATATTSFLVGQPVTADLLTSPGTLPTGSDVVTSTVTVTTHATYPTPLTLQGAVTTPAPGTSVALFQSGGKTYAYESGTGGIDALDVTDPANPTLLEVFGQSDITNGQFGFNVARVVNGELIVGTSNGNNGSVFNLLVYSLANPASPQFVSNTTINYRFLSDLLVNSTGTAAFVPTNGFFYSGRTIFQDFGDFVSIDLTDPTQPALGSSLFNNQGQPDGGDMNQFGGTLVNDQIAYSAGISPGGFTIIGNTGNLLVVNVADPKNMSLIKQLKIPGTVNILDVAAHGNRALVIGSVGTESNVYDPNATGVFNHLALTVLDITDPANPQILGSTFVTNEQFPLNEAGAKTDVVNLGNGDFAVSDTDNNGNPALLVIDPSNPDNIVVSAAQVPSGVHGITISGDTLYATTSSGLSIYQIGQLKSDPVTISVSLPPGTAADIVASSYNIPPTRVVTGTNADTLEWDRSFSAGDTTFSFNWQTKVSDVQAGQAVPVTLGATVSYVNQGTPGTLTLPGTSVTGAPIISISPASLTEQPGGTATYDVRLENPTAAQVSYNLNVLGLPSGVTVSQPTSSITVPADGSVDVPLTLKSTTNAQAGNTPFTVTADYVLLASDNLTKLGEFKGSAASSLTIAGQPVIQPDPEAHGVVVSLTPARAVAGQGTSASYVIQLTNVGSADDHFNISVTGLPGGVSASFSPNPFFLNLPPSASNFRNVNLILTTANGTPPGDISFTITATSAALPTVSGSAQGTLGVVASGVVVSLDPQSDKPGASFHLTVTNTGTMQDTFDLALAGPAALVSTLGVSKITLAPGASQVVPITTGGVAFAVPGSLDLTAMATSETSPSVRNGASANLDIAMNTGLTAQFSPPTQTISAPGPTSFLLQVNNTGNVEDSYSAVITGTTGPVIASLVGLDGQPTASIPLFRLPGLSSGAITLQAIMTGPGQATVTILVTSLSTGQTTTLTANITVGAAVGVFDGPQITALKRYGIHMKPTTIVLTFDQPLDPTRAGRQRVSPRRSRGACDTDQEGRL